MVYPPPPTNDRAPTLNAIRPSRHQPEPAHDAAERKARHLRLCQELIELGMTLARAAASRALDDIAAPPSVMSIPGSAAGAIAEAQHKARQRNPNHGRLFTHLSHAIRQTMLLETHIAEGHAPAPDHATPHPQATGKTASNHDPNREPLRRETLERLDCTLLTGPNADAPIEDLLHTVRTELGLHPAHMPAGHRPPKATEPAVSTPPHPPSPAPQPQSDADKLAKNTRHSGRRW